MKKAKKVTPLMKQYNAIKAKYPDALLLFRVGDFYETFGSDAIKAAGILGIILTKRGAGSESEIELAGFPHHSINTYLPKLVKAGERVAICDQLEDPKQTKTIVKRGVTELVTPGVALNDEVLVSKSNNFLCSVYFDKKYIAEVRRSRREQTELSIVMMDIDHFKVVNDTYGHVVGDEVIKFVASTLKKNLKRTTDDACRYGGEEFALILPNTDLEGATLLAEMLRETISNQTIKLDVDFNALIASLGASGTFDVNSPRVVRPNDALVSQQEFTDIIYSGVIDPLNNGRGQIKFIAEDAGVGPYYLYLT